MENDAAVELERLEEEFVLLLAEQYEKHGSSAFTEADIQSRLRIDEGQLQILFHRLAGNDLFQATSTSVHARPDAVDWARDIRAARAASGEPPDRVGGFDAWARRNRIMAGVIIVFKYGGPIVGMIGGILGIVALVRSC